MVNIKKELKDLEIPQNLISDVLRFEKSEATWKQLITDLKKVSVKYDPIDPLLVLRSSRPDAAFPRLAGCENGRAQHAVARIQWQYPAGLVDH